MKVRWDGWLLDVPARRLVGEEGPVHVEPQVFDVLVYLVTHRDRVVSKEELLDNVWGDQFVSESALTTRIKSIRHALGDDGKTQKYVRNVHGRGYQFVGRFQDDHQSSDNEGGDVDLAQSVGLDEEFPFVGRDLEIAAALGVLENPGFGFVFIGGVPGVGKTRLAIELMERSRHKSSLLAAARCEEHLSSSLQPVRDVVVQLAASYPLQFQVWASGFEGQLLAIAPGLVRTLDGDPTPVDTYATFEVLTTVIERATQSNEMILLFDDIQRSDQSTQTFLSRLARNLGQRPISVVCTFRSIGVDLPPDTAAWIVVHTRPAGSSMIDLGRLDDDAALGLMRAVLGDGDFDAANILAKTEGHGLFLTETLRDLQLGGSSGSSIPQIVTARFNRLSNDAQLLVRIGAALGSEFSFETAVSASGLTEADALDAIDQAIASDLLHVGASPDRFRFSHQLIPQAILDSTTPLTLASAHRQCGQALEQEGAPEILLAHHALRAVPLVPAERAIKRSREAASQEVDANNFDGAIHILKEALSVAADARSRAELLIDAGRAENAAGRAVAGSDQFEEAAAIARDQGWNDILVEAAMGHMGRSPYRRPRSTTTLELLADADKAIGDTPSVAKARIMAKTAAFSRLRAPFDQGDASSLAALAMAKDVHPLQRIELLELRAVVLACPAGVHQLGEIDAELNPLRDLHGVYAADASVPEIRLMMLAQGEEMRAVARPDTVRIKSQPIAEWRDLSLRATFSAWDGDLEGADRLHEEAASIGELFWGDSSHYVFAFAHLFLAQLSGEWRRAIDLIEALYAEDRTQLVLAVDTWANLSAGDRVRGRELAALIRADALSKLGEHILGGNALVAAAEVALLLDSDDLAGAAEAALLPYSDLMLGTPWASSLAAAEPLARLARRRGDSEAADLFEIRSMEIYTSLQAPVLLSRLGAPVSRQ